MPLAARARLRDGLGDLPLDRPRARRRLRAARVQGLRARPRRRLSLPLGAGERRDPAARPRGGRPLLLLRPQAELADRDHARRDVGLDLARPPDVRAVPRDSAGRVRHRARAAHARRRSSGTGSSVSPSSGCRWRSRSSGCSPSSRQTIPVSPGPAQLAKNLHHYRADLVVHSLSRYSLAPARIDRNGAVTIVALLLVPLALLARRRRWSALVLGGTVAVLAIELWPIVFPHFSNLVSLSQSRRLSGFIPFAVALAGGFAIISRFSRTLALVGRAGGAASGSRSRTPATSGCARRRPSPRSSSGSRSTAASPRSSPEPFSRGGASGSRRRRARAAREGDRRSGRLLPRPARRRPRLLDVDAGGQARPGRAHAGADPLPAARRRAALGRLRGPRHELPDGRHSRPSTSSPCRRPTPRTRGRTSSPSAGGRC